MQPVAIAVGSAGNQASVLGLGLYYCQNKASTCTDNNGNLQTESIGPASVEQNFKYDKLNRLIAAAENPSADMSLLVNDTSCSATSFASVWWQRYCHDNFGNRWVNASSYLPRSSFTPTSSANYLDPSHGYQASNRVFVNGSTYDLAGNQIAIGGYTFQYDAENRQTEANLANGQTGVSSNGYVYDGSGRRVQKLTCPSGTSTCAAAVATGVTNYVYDASGNMAAEYLVSGTPPANLCTTCYLSVDHLGSTRAITDGTSGAVVERHDYLPYGEDIYATTGGRNTDTLKYLAGSDQMNVRQRFTGKERDAETGLDFFGARYFSGAQGRFTTPDEVFADQHPADPQSWNLYAYVRNNPLRFIDDDGRIKRDADGNPIFTAEGKTGSVTHPSGERSTVQPGYLTADDGTHISAFQNVGNNHKLDTDCHGLTFADGKYWVSDPAVKDLLKGDNYQQTDKANPGDVVVYTDANGNVVHSVTVTGVGENGKPTEVSGLGGVETQAHSNSPTPGPGGGWSDPNAKATVYSKPDATPQQRQTQVERSKTFKKPDNKPEGK